MRVLSILTVALACLVFTNSVQAERTVSRKTLSMRVPGANPDIFVPFHTNGRGNLGVYQGVAPIIINNPGVGNNNQTSGRPVFNLIFYGSKLGSNNSFNGAVQREPNKLRPNR